MSERTEIVHLGFEVADAEAPRLSLTQQQLRVDFVDWRDSPVAILFRDCVAVRWQEAERFLDEGDRYDSTVRVHDSSWLAEHIQQGDVCAGDRPFQHVKLNFNAAGQLEVLCTAVEVLPRPEALP